MITVFTPSFADEANTNAQNLTVKEVVARLDPGKFRVIMFAQGAVDARIAGRPNTSILRWRKHGNTLRTMASFLGEIPDIYFFPREGPLDAAVLYARKYAHLRTAVVTYIVSGGIERTGLRPTLARNIAQSDVTVANSRHLALLMSQRTGADVSTIYDGVDSRYFYPRSDGEARRLTVLYAGSFRPWKRVHMVVEQAAIWPTVEFRIAGTGEDEQKCRDLAVRLGCKNVRFLGHLSQSQLGDQMRAADLFFFPSEMEGHPQVLGQAAACGLPCVAISSYRPEFVVDGKTGLLAKTDDELGWKLAILLTNGELRHSMYCAAIAHMRQFDWDRISAQWQEVFEAAAWKRRNRVRIWNKIFGSGSEFSTVAHTTVPTTPSDVQSLG